MYSSKKSNYALIKQIREPRRKEVVLGSISYIQEIAEVEFQTKFLTPNSVMSISRTSDTFSSLLMIKQYN